MPSVHMTLSLYIVSGDSLEGCKLPSLSCPESILPLTSSPVAVNRTICKTYNPELTMLDIYAGCGGMSTGLCMGAKHSGINLVTVISLTQLRNRV